MIIYKFLNADRSKSAQYVTDSFYDESEKKLLDLFYVTEIREVDPEIIQAGVNIEVGMYTHVFFVELAKSTGLTLEIIGDNGIITD